MFLFLLYEVAASGWLTSSSCRRPHADGTKSRDHPIDERLVLLCYGSSDINHGEQDEDVSLQKGNHDVQTVEKNTSVTRSPAKMFAHRRTVRERRRARWLISSIGTIRGAKNGIGPTKCCRYLSIPCSRTPCRL